MTRNRYDFNLKNLGLFVGLIGLTAILASVLYGGIHGFDYLGRELKGASAVMLAAFNRPPGTMNQGMAPQQMYQPMGQQQMHQPMGQQQMHQPMGQQQMHPGMAYNPNGQFGSAPQPNTVAGQFYCPQHGSIGLPVYDQNSVPYCPLCGQMMYFNSNNVGP